MDGAARANLNELAVALPPLARRLFTSPRLRPVIEERLRHTGMPLPADQPTVGDTRPASPPHAGG